MDLQVIQRMIEMDVDMIQLMLHLDLHISWVVRLLEKRNPDGYQKQSNKT